MRIREQTQLTPTLQLLKTLPGIGDILAIVIDREIGLVARFETAENLASYAGTTPKVKSIGGKTYYGPMRKESNQYLKCAFVEAANVIVRWRNAPSWRKRHVVRLYERTARRKGHAIAVGAVAYKRFSWKGLVQTLESTVIDIGMVMLLISLSATFSTVLSGTEYHKRGPSLW